MAAFDANAYTSPFMLTKSMHRNIYPAIDPNNPELVADKKVVVVFGAAGGIGFVSCLMGLSLLYIATPVLIIS